MISALTLILLARHLRVEVFGQYVAALAFLNVASILFSLGLDSWLLHVCGNSKDLACLATAWTTSAVVKGGLGIFWVAAMWGLGAAWPNKIFTPSLLLWGALSVWLEELVGLAWNVFKAALRNRETLVLMTLFHVIVLMANLIGIWLNAATAEAFLIARVTAAGVVAVITLSWLVRVFGIRFERSLFWPSMRAAMPFGLSMFLSLIYGRADIIIVAHWLGSQAAGFYGPAVSLLATFLLIPASVYGVVVPYLSGVYREDPERLKTVVHSSIVWHGLLGLGMTLTIILSARPLVLLIYGDKYLLTGKLLQILSFISFVRCLTLILAAILIAIGQQKQRVIVQLLAAIFNLVG
ncbi:MAG: oligosaccharide flippase family protein, partial [Candidatus Bilamarchaeaceae archaeon]